MKKSKIARLTDDERAEGRRALLDHMNDWVPPTVVSDPAEAAEDEAAEPPRQEEESREV